jgi:exosome complex RNA-binding protein Rrp42 (RNase PH superfamily)
MRADGRKNEQLRPLSVELGVIASADGSSRLTCGSSALVLVLFTTMVLVLVTTLPE